MDLYGHLMPEVFDGAAKRTEDFVFGLATGSEQQKGVTANAVTPRNDLVAGARFELATFGL